MNSPINSSNYMLLLYLIKRMTNGSGYTNFTLNQACLELSLSAEVLLPIMQLAIDHKIITEVDSEGILEYQMTIEQVLQSQTLLIDWVIQRLSDANL